MTYSKEILESSNLEANLEHNFENNVVKLIIHTSDNTYYITRYYNEIDFKYVISKDGVNPYYITSIELQPILARIEDKYKKSIEELTHDCFFYD